MARIADDVRTNPKYGDIVAKGRYERTVINVGQHFLTCHVRDLRSGTIRAVQPWPSQWRKWAANAEVIHVAN